MNARAVHICRAAAVIPARCTVVRRRLTSEPTVNTDRRFESVCYLKPVSCRSPKSGLLTELGLRASITSTEFGSDQLTDGWRPVGMLAVTLPAHPRPTVPVESHALCPEQPSPAAVMP
jgi:hypothetical protein